MLSETISRLINDQMNAEMYASNLYLQMASWCDEKGMAGAAEFFQTHMREELDHRDRFIQFLFDCGSPVTVHAVQAPPTEWGSLLDVLKAAYEHEQHVTALINNIAAEALKTNDFNTLNFLQWFIEEQREEESLFRGVLDQTSLAAFDGDSGEAMWHVNQYLSRISGAGAQNAPAQA